MAKEMLTFEPLKPEELKARRDKERERLEETYLFPEYGDIAPIQEQKIEDDPAQGELFDPDNYASVPDFDQERLFDPDNYPVAPANIKSDKGSNDEEVYTLSDEDIQILEDSDDLDTFEKNVEDRKHKEEPPIDTKIPPNEIIETEYEDMVDAINSHTYLSGKISPEIAAIVYPFQYGGTLVLRFRSSLYDLRELYYTPVNLKGLEENKEDLKDIPMYRLYDIIMSDSNLTKKHLNYIMQDPYVQDVINGIEFLKRIKNSTLYGSDRETKENLEKLLELLQAHFKYQVVTHTNFEEFTKSKSPKNVVKYVAEMLPKIGVEHDPHFQTVTIDPKLYEEYKEQMRDEKVRQYENERIKKILDSIEFGKREFLVPSKK